MRTLNRIRRARWVVIPLLSSLVLGLLFALTAGAASIDITIDGDCSEWTAKEWILDDGDETHIPDQYDIRDVYASFNADKSMHAVHYETGANLYVNSGAFTQIWYDIDANAATGYPIGNIGAERRVLWNMDTDICRVYSWNPGLSQWVLVANDCNGEPCGIGQKASTCVEIGADTEDLGIDSSGQIALCMLFENADFVGPADDTTCFVFGETCCDHGVGTPGYWKNHPDAWPVEYITIGGVTYSKAEAIEIMNTPERGDKTYTMFRALVAAKLNVLDGNDSSCIADTIAEADEWMATYGPVGSGVRAGGRNSPWREGEPLYEKLDDYNNGLLCAPARD